LSAGKRVLLVRDNHNSNLIPFLQRSDVIIDFLEVAADSGQIIVDEEKIKAADLLALTQVSQCFWS